MPHVGIDLHKRQSQICVLHEDGRIEERTVLTTPERMRRTLEPHRGSPVLLEAATESEWVARCLEEHGHTVIVADPNYQAMYGPRYRRAKTDRRDARALAEACRQGNYRRAHRASEPHRALKGELAVREALVRQRTAHISLVRALARAEGARVRSGESATFPRRVAEAGLSESLSERIAPLLRTIEAVTAELRGIDARLGRLAQHHALAERLRSVPSVGPITALAFIATLDDAHRFGTADEVASYLGLVPREWSSGERRYRGGIHKAGCSRARWLLVEAAWRLLRMRDPGTEPLRQWAMRIAARRGRLVAVVALARRLSGILFAVWRDDTPYCAQRLIRRRAAA